MIPLSESTRVDLALAGHTHGGQVALPFFGPPYTSSPLPRKYAGGLHDYQGTLLHVSRGVGMERGPAPPGPLPVPARDLRARPAALIGARLGRLQPDSTELRRLSLANDAGVPQVREASDFRRAAGPAVRLYRAVARAA